MTPRGDITGWLSDDVLLYIFARVPVDYLPRAGAVCKRWNHLFHHLRLNDRNFYFNISSSLQDSELAQVGYNKLLGWTGLYLRLIGPGKLKGFSLTIIPFISHLKDMYNLLHLVAEKCVETVKFDFCFELEPVIQDKLSEGENTKFMLPVNLFQSKTITHLNVSRSDFTVPDDFLGLRNLSHLHLYKVNITDEMLERMLVNCPSIEVLRIRGCYNLSRVRIWGENLRLKSLALLDTQETLRLLEMFVPNLLTLNFNGITDPSDNIYLPSLVDAFIWDYSPYITDHDYKRFHLLGLLTHVQILTLCAIILVDMYVEDDIGNAILPITFGNLIELQILVWKGFVEDIIIPGFFRLFSYCIFPSLEKLFIELDCFPFNKFLCEDRNIEIPGIPIKVFSKLKMVKMTNFHGYTNEILMVEFLLERAVALEFLVLVRAAITEEDIGDSSSYFETRLSYALQKLSSFPKASIKAEIMLHKYGEDCCFVATHKRTQWDPDKYTM